jgi:hypothetical protein
MASPDIASIDRRLAELKRCAKAVEDALASGKEAVIAEADANYGVEGIHEYEDLQDLKALIMATTTTTRSLTH